MIDKRSCAGDICARWWRSAINVDTGRARKTRAELRRADTPLAVLGVSAVHDLNRILEEVGYGLCHRPDGPDRLALIAVVLAHVKEGRGATAARRFGAGDPKPLSVLRFNTLIRAETPRELIRPLVRALAIIGGSTDVRKLADDLYWWNDRVRTDWCFDYYGASNAKPVVEDEET